MPGSQGRTVTRALFAAASLLSIFGCEDPVGGGESEPRVPTLTVTPDTVTITLGGLRQLTAVYRDAEGKADSARAIVWTSSDSTIARVDQSGSVFSVYPGSVKIVATASGLADTASVSVVAGSSALRLLPERSTLIAGTTYPLFARAAGFGPRTRDWRAGELRWTSSDEAVARVDSAGIVQGMAPGSATITVTVVATGISSSAALTVTPRVEVAQVSAGGLHSCALTVAGEALCWGDADYGAVGVRTAEEYCNQYGCKLRPALSPVAVSTPMTFASVSAGRGYLYEAHSCGTSTDGRAYCWGMLASSPFVGGGTCAAGMSLPHPCTFTPVSMDAPVTLRALGTGNRYSCGLSEGGAVYCWGSNTRAQTGQPATEHWVATPRAVTHPRPFVALSVGNNHSCALESDGAAYCWGDNQSGQLWSGAPDTVTRPVPVRAAGTLRFVAIVAGDANSCGITLAGETHCWGFDPGGLNAGAGVSRERGMAFQSVAITRSHACALTRAGEAYCWGDNREGQLGTGAAGADAVREPTPVTGGLRWRSLSLGASHTCGISTAGIAYCWGYNRSGQLGVGDVSPRAVPTRVLGQR